MATHEPSLSNHHSNMILEGKKMQSRLLDMSYINMGGVRVYEDIAPTLTSRDYKEPRMVLEGEEMKIMNNTKKGYIECPIGGCFDGQFPTSNSRRGRVQENGNVTPTLTANGSQDIYYNEGEYRIRKLTPKECYRLMGYKDKDYENAEMNNSGTQLYKQAGNAIVKQVLMAIFLQMGIQGKKKWNDMTKEERQELIKGSILKD